MIVFADFKEKEKLQDLLDLSNDSNLKFQMFFTINKTRILEFSKLSEEILVIGNNEAIEVLDQACIDYITWENYI